MSFRSCGCCFAGSTLPLSQRTQTSRRPLWVCEAAKETRASALDSLPAHLKLNAVAESLARSRDVKAALAVTAELRSLGAPLHTRARAAIVDAIAAAPGPAAAQRLEQLFDNSRPRGFGAANVVRLGPTDSKASRKALSASEKELLPDPGRRVDMGVAAAFLAVVGSSLTAEVVEPVVLHHAANEATSVLMLVGGGLLYDRFAASGQFWDKVSSGFTRLFSDDPEREASVESAYFLVAYLMGLSCAPFQPNVSQVLQLHAPAVRQERRAKRAKRKKARAKKGKIASNARGVEGTSAKVPVDEPSAKSDESLVADQPMSTTVARVDSGKLRENEQASAALDDALLDRYLTWLLAGVAAESLLDGVLLESDPGRARELLKATRGLDEQRIFFAFSQAKSLLVRHQVAHAKLADSMLAGLSAGECVNLLEKEIR